MTPEEALEYMKRTENLVIIDVAATAQYEKSILLEQSIFL